ncbi:MAG TPA: FAD-dependent oxidoreductase [Polyangia bacterium]|jgi:ferredoxin-NADP reductase
MSKQAKVASIRPLAEGVFEWRLRMVDPPAVTFRPGQYVSLDCGVDAHGLPQRRAYSIASPPTEPHGLTLCAKLISGGVGSRYLGELEEGDAVDFTGPMGMFVLELLHPGDVVFAATGTGVAPFLPMLHEALAREERGDVLLFWGLRSQADLFYVDELERLAAANPRLTAHVTLSRPKGHWAGERGRITPKLLEALPLMRDPVFYLAGNGAMIEELRRALLDRGVPRRRVHTEAFFEAAAPPAPAAPPA